MPRPPPGLYEVLVTEVLANELTGLGETLTAEQRELDASELGDRIGLHLGRVVERAVNAIAESDRKEVATALSRRLAGAIDATVDGADAAADAVAAPPRMLSAIRRRNPDGSPERIAPPLIPLLDTTLLTNSPGEPRVGSQLLAEIGSADRLDVVMAFVRRSGINPLADALRRHCGQGKRLRLLTTTFTGTTELAALELLQKLGAEVRVSYDTTSTRLHAKAWLFLRDSGFSTAYVGSSNLTHSAQITGLEWNVRISGARNPGVIDKMRAVFESYWANPDFVPFEREDFIRRASVGGRADGGPDVILSPIELRLEPFQERLLEQVALARENGSTRNLLVAATGTGKTVMAAVDYGRLRERMDRSRLLFVAHRAELLKQSLATFRYALRDAAFGELWVGGARPQRWEHVFASIQNLHAADLEHLAPDHFDVVVVDEFHHAAARTYAALLDRLRPRQLLGLTATPERSDGLPLLDFFGGEIAAELRLWDAIDQRRLVPFLYYGVHDGTDLTRVAWQRGRGYDVEGLTNLLTADDANARFVLKEFAEKVGDVGAARALGFCVSVRHARFMARVFTQAGVRAEAVWSDTPDEERARALRDLGAGRLNVLFSVDLFNEGVDVPTVDTLLLLRPTDSATLFLQQLGRGLRVSPGKTACTVLDFVGVHRKEFRFDRRYRALVGGTRKGLIEQIEGGFPFLPAGCHFELDSVAAEIVLRNVRECLPTTAAARAAELRALASSGGEATLTAYLRETGLELEDVYAGNHSWSDLCEGAGLSVGASGPKEKELRRACGRLLHIDDRERITFYGALLRSATPPRVAELPPSKRRLVRMLVASLANQLLNATQSLQSAVDLVWAHPQVMSELRELLQVLEERISHVNAPLAARHRDVPLSIHARYTRLEILAAFGEREDVARVPLWQTGAYWADDAKSDLFAFTLDKTDGRFSPTTRYRDYAISREKIHWESQSVTRADSETGQRYQQHVRLGTSIMLFARLRADDRAFWFLGPATYVSHESERPMSVIWRLEHPLPGDLFEQFAAAVA